MNFLDSYILFNSLEALLWILIAIILFIRIFYISQPFKHNTLLGSITFAIFGLSDVAEIIIGGIFAPDQYWLLALKSVCVVTFIVLFVRYVKIRKSVGI